MDFNILHNLINIIIDTHVQSIFTDGRLCGNYLEICACAHPRVWVPCLMCGRPTSLTGRPQLLLCSKETLLLAFAITRLAGLQTSMASLVSAPPRLTVEAQRLQMFRPGFMRVLEIKAQVLMLALFTELPWQGIHGCQSSS